MSKGEAAYIVGAYEHPTRHAVDRSIGQLHVDVATGALADAGLTFADVDGFCTAAAPGVGAFSVIEHLGLRVRHIDSSDLGGAAYIGHVDHAAQAIKAGKCDVILITLAGRPKAEGDTQISSGPPGFDYGFDAPYRPVLANSYGMVAMRHMYEYGTTSEQLAWIKVAASHHAQHNPHAVLRDVVTVEGVLASPIIADPLHRLDCCVMSDGGGALVVASESIARSLRRPLVKVLGAGEAVKHPNGGYNDMTFSGGVASGAAAFDEAGVSAADIKYASIYDSFTITVLVALEDLGFCARGLGGKFVSDGNLISGVGSLPFNTDGGGLCNNHPFHRGGMTKVIEAVRQLRGEAHPAVQVGNCDLALAHGTGGFLSKWHGSATLIMERI